VAGKLAAVLVKVVVRVSKVIQVKTIATRVSKVIQATATQTVAVLSIHNRLILHVLLVRHILPNWRLIQVECLLFKLLRL